MDRSYIPITTFYKQCLPAARQNGYRFVMCLLAREADIESLYPELEKQWYSIDDLTGKDFLFMFTGKYKEDDVDSGIWHRGEYGNEAVVINEFIHIFNRDLQLKYGDYYNFRDRSKRARWTPELPEMQTRAVTNLRDIFGLSERDIPCIIFTNLYNRVNTVLRINNSNIYRIVKDVCLEVEKLFKTIDALTVEIEKLSLITSSKEYNKYLNWKRYENNLQALAEQLIEDKRILLLDCIEKRIMGNGLFCEIIDKNLNAYVGLFNSIKNADIDSFESIDVGEPKHSIENLERLYSRADSIISAYNLQIN